MKDRLLDEHLTPEHFIDVLDGAPMEASHRLHVERCEACRGELAELTSTLAVLRSTDDTVQTPNPGLEMPRRRAKGLGLWLVAAAAILVALVVSYPKVRPGDDFVASNGIASEHEGLLPPAELDEAFQVLLALSEELEGSEALGAQAEGTDVVPSAIDELTPAERGMVMERLAEEMRSSS